MTGISEKRVQTAISRVGPKTVIVASVGAVFAIIVGLLLVGVDPTASAAIPAALAVLLIAIASPFSALTITLIQFAFIPSEGYLLGAFVPNVLQFLAPVTFIAAVFKALKDGDHSALRPRLADWAVVGFGLWGLVGKFATSGITSKWYGNRMLLPMLIYFAIRLIRIDQKKFRTLVLICLVAVAIQSLLMLEEGMTSSSLLYEGEEKTVEGVVPVKGPFPAFFSAGVYLALWPSVFIYAIAKSRSRTGRAGWAVGLMLTMLAITRTMERAAIGAAILGILVCLLSPRLRKTAMACAFVLVIAYIPWSLSSSGGALMERFNETDQSRYARRVVAFNIMKSSDWNPLLGIGWNNYNQVRAGHGTDERIIAFGTRTTTIGGVGGALHNVWLSIPVEFGLGGVAFSIILLVLLARRVSQLWHSDMHGQEKDSGLWVALIGSLAALAFHGYYHNTYDFAATMSMMWAFYGMFIAHPSALWDDGLTEKTHPDTLQG